MQPAPPSTIKKRRDFLRSVEMFERLPNAALDRLVLTFERQVLPAETIVFRQGDHGDRMYLVEEGKVDLHRSDEHGRVHRIATIDAGGYFGELALLSDSPRVATAQCVGSAELLSISGRDLKRLLTESPPALRSIVGAVKEYKPPEKPPPFWQRLGGRKATAPALPPETVQSSAAPPPSA